MMFSFYLGFSQKETIRPDSIEYCWWQQIYNFNLADNKYYFREYGDNSIVETDSLVFEPTTYFSNFTTKTDYVDSVRFAIVSRTLKFYHEPILYNSPYQFIRIVWLKYKTPVLLTIISKNDSVQLTYKECDGSCDIHGKILKKQSKTISLELYKTSLDLLEKSDFFSLKHGITYCHKDTIPLSQPYFFIESKSEKSYNIVNINECNLDYKDYQQFYKLFKYIIKKENL